MDALVPLVGQKAIDFSAQALMPDGTVVDKFNLFEAVNGKRFVLFFYPLDFTFVCPTEILAFSHRVEEFKGLNTEVIGVSVDSVFCHQAWRNTPINQGGIGDIALTLVADINKQISTDYRVLLDGSIAARATYIVDHNFIIRHVSINDLPLGRNADEVLRLIKAMKHNEEHGDVCPAGWAEGKDSIAPTRDGISDYLISNANEL